MFPGSTSMMCHIAYFQLKYEKFDLDQFLEFMEFSCCLLSLVKGKQSSPVDTLN